VLVDERLYIDSPGLFQCILTYWIETNPIQPESQISSAAKLKSTNFGQQPGKAWTPNWRARLNARAMGPICVKKPHVFPLFDDVDAAAHRDRCEVNSLHNNLEQRESAGANLPGHIGELMSEPLQRGVCVVALMPDDTYWYVRTVIGCRAHFQFTVPLQFATKR